MVRIEERSRKAMMHIGGFAMKTMRRMMRKSTAPMPHAIPPMAPKYSAKTIRRLTFFAYEDRIRGVVVGPVPFPGGKIVTPIGKTVPQLLDEGGAAVMRKEQTVLKDRATNRIYSLSSLGAQKIIRRSSFRKSLKKKGAARQKARYHFMKIKPGIAKFMPRPFREPTKAIAFSAPQLQRAWSFVR